MLRLAASLLALVLVSAALAAPPAGADPASSETRIKIHRARLRAAITASRDDGSRPIEPCQSGSLEVGTVEIERGARVPSEITVVVEGDVINLNDGRGSHICR